MYTVTETNAKIDRDDRVVCTTLIWTFSAKVESIMRGGTKTLSAPNLSTNLKD